MVYKYTIFDDDIEDIEHLDFLGKPSENKETDTQESNDTDLPWSPDTDTKSKLPFRLSYEQIAAIQNILKFINNKRGPKEYLLSGSAGTGKSSILSQVVAYLDNKDYDYVACAPTHKARINLEGLTKSGTITLHQLLQLKPNIAIELFDRRNLEFESGLVGNKSRLPRLVIIDECSMITDDLYEFIQEEVIKKRKIKVLYVGDSAQLKGVGSRTVSKVFSIPDKTVLTKIYRQQDEAPLLYILQDLRTKPCYTRFKEFTSKSGNLYTYTDVKPFIINVAKQFKEAIYNKDTNAVRVLTYTNSRLNEYNRILKNILFKNAELEYSPGEFLMGYDNYSGIFNSLDYIVTEVEEVECDICDVLRDVHAYYLTLRDVIYDRDIMILMLASDNGQDVFDTYADALEDARLSAIRIDKRANKKLHGRLWAYYYTLRDAFATPIDIVYDGRLLRSATLKPGYAISAHKSQGSSIYNVFIDMKDIMRCYDTEELRQLQYVALSRTKNDVHILN